MEIDTALSDLEAADFAELVNVLVFCSHCIVSFCLGVIFRSLKKNPNSKLIRSF